MANAAGIPTICPMDEHGQFTAEVGPWAGTHVFDANPLVIRGLEGARCRAPPRHLRPLVSALLAVQPAARVPGDLVVVREGHRVPRPDGRAQPADHLAARAHQGRQLRQVAGERPRLVDQPQPLLGVADPGVAVGRPEPPADRRLRLDRPTRGRLRRDRHRPAPAARRRADPPEPRRPDGAVDDAPRPRGARLLVRVGIDAVRPGALPVREHRVVRAPLSRRLHRRVHRPDPRVVLHAPRPRHRVVRPAQLRHVRQPRHRARRRRPEDVEEPQQLPGPAGDVRQLRRRRHAVAPAVVVDPARQRRDGHRDRHPRHGPPRPAPAVELVVLPGAVRQRLRSSRHGPHRLDELARPVHPVEDARPDRRRHRHDGRLRPVRRLPARSQLRRCAHQLVRAAQPDPASGRATTRRSTRCTPCSTW